MIQIRTSQTAEVPRLRELWKLAFGDEDNYIQHFFQQYYRPERMLVLLEEGRVQAMTAWFDTDLLDQRGERRRAAYLYAVATHPDCRGKGFASRLLAWADDYLYREQGFDCVTTVPARPDLHVFFGRNGFREYFPLCRWELGERQVSGPAGEDGVSLQPLDAQQYGVLRETLLSGRPHVSYCQAALDYQQGCCRMSGGGLFRVEHPLGTACACVERGDGGLVVVKELLGHAPAAQEFCRSLPRTFPGRRWQVREPAWACRPEDRPGCEQMDFAMIKWLDPRQREQPHMPVGSYLGLAFD